LALYVKIGRTRYLYLHLNLKEQGSLTPMSGHLVIVIKTNIKIVDKLFKSYLKDTTTYRCIQSIMSSKIFLISKSI